MSFLNDLLGGGQGNPASGSSLVAVAGQLIDKAGGVQGLVVTKPDAPETVQSSITTAVHWTG